MIDMTKQGYPMRRNYLIRRIMTFVMFGCLALAFFIAKRDLFTFGNTPDFNKPETGIYSPPTVGDAVKFIADMNTYLYHEARCSHISEEDAAITQAKVAAGVRLDFPGWWVGDNMALKIKTWIAHRHIDDISCGHATVDFPSLMLNNISHYAGRS